MVNEKSKKVLNILVTEKIVMLHMLMVAFVCVIFGVINVFAGSAVVGIAIILVGILMPLFISLIKKKVSVVTRGIILSYIQIIVIIVMAIFKNELHGMFPIMLASMAMAGIYLSLKTLIAKWIIIDVAVIIGCIFFDVFYEGATLEMVIKGIFGINIGAYLIYYLVKCCQNFIFETEKAKGESEKLVEEVNKQVVNTKKLMKQQGKVVTQIAQTANNLGNSVSLMENVSSSLSVGAREQESTISDIVDDINHITAESKRCHDAAEKAFESAKKSSDMLEHNNIEVLSMVEAMGNITDASKKIEVIIKTIEDIAFQTDILALNAAIEAEKAGSAGKGFAVVADEVRDLATKSSVAANDTVELIQETISTVDSGTIIAKKVANNMKDIMEISQESSQQSQLIAELAENQADSINSVKEKMENISKVARQSLDTSENSSEVARSVAEEVNRINSIVKEYK